MKQFRIDYVRYGFGQNLPPLDESVKLKFETGIHIAYKDLAQEIIDSGAYFQAHYSKDGKSITKCVPVKFPGLLLDKLDRINWKNY